MANLERLNPQTTALVVIDLQNSVVALKGAPYSTKEVVRNAARLVNVFRGKGAFVALVRVASKDGKDMLRPTTDEAPRWGSGERPKDASEIVPEIGVTDNDHVVTKHQWGAFYGTDLDLQLRRRGIDTVVLCGIATGYGVDTTAREAYQHGYNQVFAVDAMTGLSQEEHDYVLKHIFPRIGRSRTVDEIIDALSK
ncbi:MAG: hydrolase [Alicyclobacillus macrosporangiidus]|uniref:hydrolase n=1 Tax=Alicyclobacillus macrosporangiidus TaxID=392015 RepID=UPI0026EB6BE2|nr:hydrolase [Alicyclobacillus macrosporangiidus]MCL6600398.1 hydrolase [Alicyclobacillus macrosporangiidus]